MRGTSHLSLAALLAASTLLPEGCGPDRSPPDPAAAASAASPRAIPEFPGADAFVPEIDNPYLGFEREKVFRYESETEEGLEQIVVEVTPGSKTILGVATTVVHDEVFLDGELVEDTFDWFAQDEDGNVWYFGEDSRTLEGGEVISTEGSWEAGVEGASPGIVMLAAPRIGLQYAQELAPGVAEDMARVLSLSRTVEVPLGTFDGCLQTQEWTPLERGPRESKYYAPGTGLVLETSPGGGRVELVAIE